MRSYGFKGSDVSETLQEDHALYAEQWLKDNGFAEEWEVRVADDRVLMLDYDAHPYDSPLPAQFYNTLSIFEQRMKTYQYFTVHASKGGNTHALVHLTFPLTVFERIAWQIAFGSDPKREALHLLSVSRNELNPILLFMKKSQQWSGVDEEGNNIVRSMVPAATPEQLENLMAEVKLLTAGETLSGIEKKD